MVFLVRYFLVVSESEVSKSEAENERNFQFDFLIDGIYLQETLDKHMRLYNISTVSLFLLFALIQRLCSKAQYFIAP